MIISLPEEGIGIAREVCAYKNSENLIAEGEYQGKSIKELIQEHHEELMGRDDSNQLIRAAYIDAIEDLSRKPMRFAGTWKQYSKKARNQLNRITPNKGRCSNQLNCCFIFK